MPTIANLFNLNYDPRLYMGSDAYSGDQTVIFTDGNWLNKDGIYYSTKDRFAAWKDIDVDEVSLGRINTNVQNIRKISSMILDSKYFEKREQICIVPQ